MFDFHEPFDLFDIIVFFNRWDRRTILATGIITITVIIIVITVTNIVTLIITAVAITCSFIREVWRRTNHAPPLT